MARTERHMPTTPERVFSVLVDADAYGHWVVGSDTIRDVDDTWPQVGSRFHHRVGVGPFKLNDHTQVLRIDPPHRLDLKARFRPLGTATISIRLERQGEGTLVTIVEDAGDPITRLLFNPLTHLLVRGRNVESLRRLEELAVGAVGLDDVPH
jgi:uncharacterized protein YndB with AHSA1/START domain